MKKIPWKGEGGYRELVVLSVPLIITTASWSLQQFVDRMFLSWYSPEAIAAVVPSGMLNFTIMSIFMGTCSYTTTFVAQYHGAGKNHRAGRAVWQGIYCSIAGGIILLLFVPFSDRIFNMIGHDPSIREYESVYFSILCAGSWGPLASSAIAGFFSGRGITWPVLWVNFAGTLVNIILDYILIFGKLGFPVMGVRGAAIATVISGFSVLAIYLVMFFYSPHEKEFCTRSGWRPERKLFARLIRFGFPAGLQFFLEIGTFTAFILIVGRLGMMELAASNIVFNINSVSFMPILGLGIGITVLTGQYLGKNQPDTAERSVYAGFRISFVYMFFTGLIYILLPWLLVEPFMRGSDAGRLFELRGMAELLLRFVALYSFFDAMSITFSSALKGAGDTSFVMKAVLLVAVFSLIIPTWAAVFYFNAGIYTCWWILTFYAFFLGFMFYLRFRNGRWKSMRVIEGEHGRGM
ncbi:MAG TPA: MATE family efflux transporter [Spirochaetota bacterium]|nr:MATE family efflux transporter [Spirochaetota bacterium]